MGTLGLAVQDLPMLRVQESEVNFKDYPSSSAGRVKGAHWGKRDVISEAGKDPGTGYAEK